MSISSFSKADTKTEQKLNRILYRPLIVGASVSGDYLTASPGKVLALRHTEAKEIKVVATKGTMGRDVLKSVTDASIKDRSAIIGIDLFFWDSFSTSPQESLKAIDRIVNLASENKIPIVLGEVPTLMPGRQGSVTAINKKITEACNDYSQCKILPLNSILHQVLIAGHIVQGGKTYPLETLIPDGLHIAKPASEYLADQIQMLL